MIREEEIDMGGKEADRNNEGCEMKRFGWIRQRGKKKRNSVVNKREIF
jgi:hypothetical protein